MNEEIKKQIMLTNARIDCIIDLMHLQGELIKCSLAKFATKEQYEKTVAIYDKHWTSILNDCAEQMENIISKPDFDKLTVEEAQALNEAARKTCEVDG